jgi:hypothetical protein
LPNLEQRKEKNQEMFEMKELAELRAEKGKEPRNI